MGHLTKFKFGSLTEVPCIQITTEFNLHYIKWPKKLLNVLRSTKNSCLASDPFSALGFFYNSSSASAKHSNTSVALAVSKISGSELVSVEWPQASLSNPTIAFVCQRVDMLTVFWFSSDIPVKH